MAQILTVDVAAAPAATLGVLPDLTTELNSIAGLVDLWRVDTSKITTAAGRVSSWAGIKGRTFTQATAARQPLLVDGDRVDFGNGAAGAATMLLSGAQLGQMATGSIGVRVVLAPGDEVIDNQSFAGQDLDTSGTGLVRLAYRYTAASLGNYIRVTVGAAQRDVDLPASVMSAIVWLTIANGGATVTVNGVAAATPIPVASLNLPSFAIGGARESSPLLSGSITGVCIAASVVTAQQRVAAEYAMTMPV